MTLPTDRAVAAPPASSSPLRAVLAALTEDVDRAGTTQPPSVASLARRTGLDPSVVVAVVDRLAGRGRIRRLPVTGCATAACGSCALARACDGSAGS